VRFIDYYFYYNEFQPGEENSAAPRKKSAEGKFGAARKKIKKRRAKTFFLSGI